MVPKAYILGINTMKGFIAYAMLRSSASTPAKSVVKADRLATAGARPTELVTRVIGVFDSLKREFGEFEVAIYQRSAGRFGSSLEAIKGQALVEYGCDKHGIKYQMAHPNGFRFLFGCKKDQKWQARAEKLFNPGGIIKNFDEGIDGATAAAFKFIRGGRAK